ncbi:MAG: Ig-like domain-containing protein, partial [Smithella sp.]|nr:Ig-like domain-containing protein [Smithella sp.]
MATVTTNTPTNKNQCKFTGNGSNTGFGSGSSLMARGFIWKQGSSGDPTYYDSMDNGVYSGGDFDSVAADSAGNFPDGSYSKECNGFLAGTSYRVRAIIVVVQIGGIGQPDLIFNNYYGSTITVTMTSPAVAPTVTTSAGSSITSNSCVGNGNITYTGGELCSERGFCYKVGTSGDPTTSDSKVSDTAGSYSYGTFTKAITGLSANTGYRVRAYAINSKGTSYGTTVQVTTLPLTLSLSDTITISDSITKAAGTTKADLLSIADEISKVATFVRQIADSVSISDSISKKSQIVFADEVTIADEMSKVSSYNLSFADVMVIFDDMGMTSPGNYFLSFNEILSISDSIIKSVEFGIEDTLTVEDDMSRIVAYERLIADTITVSDDMTHSKVVLRTINIVANSMLKNATQQVSVIGVYSDESASDVTQFCSFATSDIDIATIDSGGLITSISEGLVTITATLGALTTTYVLAVISESQSAALMTGIVSFANGDTYRAASYLSRRHVFKTNSISLVKVLDSKYPVTIELVFPDIPLAIPVTVENKNPVRVKSFLMEAVEVRI